VKESPVQLECKVIDIKKYGSMVLIIAEVLLGHFSKDLLDETGHIDQLKTDWIARLGKDWYTRASGDTLFEVPRPQTGIGIDALPISIRNSKILTGNDLGQLGGVLALPSQDSVQQFSQTNEIISLGEEARYGCQYLPDLLHNHAHELLATNKVEEAWLTLLQIPV